MNLPACYALPGTARCRYLYALPSAFITRAALLRSTALLRCTLPLRAPLRAALRAYALRLCALRLPARALPHLPSLFAYTLRLLAHFLPAARTRWALRGCAHLLPLLPLLLHALVPLPNARCAHSAAAWRTLHYACLPLFATPSRVPSTVIAWFA